MARMFERRMEARHEQIRRENAAIRQGGTREDIIMGRIKANARLARTLMRLSIDHFDPSEVRRLRARAWEALDDARMDKERL
jgi:hypothetical protein